MSLRNLTEQAEAEATSFKRRIWRDRTLVKTHAACIAIGVAACLWVQSNSATPQASAKATTSPTTALAAASAPASKAHGQ